MELAVAQDAGRSAGLLDIQTRVEEGKGVDMQEEADKQLLQLQCESM